MEFAQLTILRVDNLGRHLNWQRQDGKENCLPNSINLLIPAPGIWKLANYEMRVTTLHRGAFIRRETMVDLWNFGGEGDYAAGNSN